MKFKLLVLAGAIAPSFAICVPGIAGERPAGMVIAQGAFGPGQAPEKGDQPPAAGQKPAQKPAVQQHPNRPSPGAHQPAQGQKPPPQPAQAQPAPMQKPAEKPSDRQPAQRPAPMQQQPAQQQQQQPPQKPALRDERRPPGGQPGQGSQQPAQIQRPGQPPVRQGGNQQQQPQRPAMQNPPFERGRQPAAVQTQQNPVLAPGNRRLDQVRGERRETREGNRTVIREQDRTIIREGGHTIIRHNDIDRFRRGARDVNVEQRGNETFTVVVRPDGDRIITVTDADGRLLRRIRRAPNGREVVLIDNRRRGPGNGLGFILNLAPPTIRIPRDRYIVEADRADRDLLYATLIAPPIMAIERPYTLDEIRYTHTLRERMPRIDLDTITFDTGSWEVTPEQARLLEPIAEAMLRAIRRNPNEIYMIEGHTDLVGSDIDNLSLSDRRAEAVAEILTQDFGIPPENLTTQGYGEEYPKVQTQAPERLNRRVTVRRITPLLMGRN